MYSNSLMLIELVLFVFMTTKDRHISKRWYLLFAIVFLLINGLIIYSESIFLVKWSRVVNSILIIIYLIKWHKLYDHNRYLIGMILLILSDFCLVYFKNYWSNIFFFIFTAVGFATFLKDVIKFIQWKKITISSSLIVLLLFLFESYLIHNIIQLISPELEFWIILLFYVYGFTSLLYCLIATLGYLQLEKASTEHYLIVPYSFLISSAFYVIAMYSSNYVSYFYSRIFYIVCIFTLAHLIATRLRFNTKINNNVKDANSANFN